MTPTRHQPHVGALLVAALLACQIGFGTAQAELYLDGNFVQGGLVQGLTTPGAVVSVDGKQVRVSDDGVFVLGFGRNDIEPVVIEVLHSDGSIERRRIEIHAREYSIQRIDGLPPKQVTPDEAVLARIKYEADLARAARRIDTGRTDFLTGFVWPARGRISGVYGSQRILNGEPRRPHFGVDIAAPTGTQVIAPADGVISLVHDDMYFSGGTLFIDHGHGLASTFLHLSRILVVEGDAVKRGQPIAEIGASGRATGPHLDWRMSWFQKRIDPQLLVGPME